LVQPSLNTISRNGTRLQLEPKLMSVLVCLAEHPGEPVSKEKLLQTVWPDTFVGEGVLTRSISELRRMFEDEAKEPRMIQTIAKRGYCLVAPVTRLNGESAESWTRAQVGRQEKIEPAARVQKWNPWLVASTVLLISSLAILTVGHLRERALARSGVPQIHSLA